MIKRLFTVPICCCLFFAVVASSHAKILPEDHMVDILVDLELARALAYDCENTDKNKADALFLENAKLIYEVHHTDATNFQNSYGYYFTNTQLMLRLYEKVVSRLEANLAAMQ